MAIDKVKEVVENMMPDKHLIDLYDPEKEYSERDLQIIRNKAIDECTLITTKLLAEKDKEIERLKEENKELEQFYTSMSNILRDNNIGMGGEPDIVKYIQRLEEENERLKGAVLSEEEIHGALARGYCYEPNTTKVVEADLIMTMTDEIIKAQQDKLGEVNG